MKRHLLSLLALVIAIASVAFTHPNAFTKKNSDKYFVYSGSGNHELRASYDYDSPIEAASYTQCTGSSSMCAIRVNNEDDGVLTNAEAETVVEEQAGTGASNFTAQWSGTSGASDYQE